MRLVLFTGHYPYRGEVFLQDEIRIAEHYFQEIVIVTLEKNTCETVYYIPPNARVIKVRSDYSKFRKLGRAVFLAIFKHNAFSEIYYAIRERGWKNIKEAAHAILADERAVVCLEDMENQWIEGDIETVYYAYWLGAEATYIARNKEKLKGLCIARTHGGDCFFDRAYHPYRRQQLFSLEAIYPISDAGRNDILKYYNSVCEGLELKLHVAHLGIQLHDDMINPWEEKKDKTIVTCSNVIPLKRLDLIIDALSEINEINIKWVHFGDGYEMSVIQKRAQEKLSNQKNIDYFFKGYMRKDDILAYYKQESIDLFVNCSDVEGIPVSMMEAMAYGIPAIARNVGGIRELLDDNCGKLLPQNISSSQLAQAISDFFEQSNQDIQKLRNNARTCVHSRFSAENNYNYFYKSQLGIINKDE